MKKVLNKIVELDKSLINKAKEKWNLSDYQIACIRLGKGFIIGAILL